MADLTHPANEEVTELILDLQAGKVSMCACMGPVCGEPYCPCEMDRRGLPPSARREQEAKEAHERFAALVASGIFGGSPMTTEYHVLILGHSEKGKSVLTQVLNGTRIGQTLPDGVDPAPAPMTPEERREYALKTTYWATSDPMEFCNLRDALCHFGNVTEVSDDQQRAFFMALPGTTFGQGVTWGFDDTEVRDDVWSFARDNPAIVANALAASDKVPGIECEHAWADWLRTPAGRERRCPRCGQVEGERLDGRPRVQPADQTGLDEKSPDDRGLRVRLLYPRAGA